MPRDKKLKLFEVKIEGLPSIEDAIPLIYVQAFSKAQAIAFARPNVTARELGAVEAVGVKEEDVKDATK